MIINLRNNNALMILIFSSIMGAGGIFIGWKRFMQNEPKNLASNDVLIMGTASGYAPWVSLNEQGEYEGFDVDIAKELAKQMNKKLVLKDLGSMGPLFLGLEQGKVDAIIWGISITRERLQKVAFVKYQGEATTSYPLIFWKEIPQGVSSINDLKKIKNCTICVEPASAQEPVLKKYEFITPKPMEKITDAIMDVQFGKSLAVIVEPAIATNMKQRFSEIKTLDVPLDPDEQEFGAGIAIKKDNESLITQINQAIEVMKNNGTIANLEKKWKIV